MFKTNRGNGWNALELVYDLKSLNKNICCFSARCVCYNVRRICHNARRVSRLRQHGRSKQENEAYPEDRFHAVQRNGVVER
jgi:hypothetical protein